MYKFSFKIKHKNCAETEFSTKFPQYHITVIDIQSKSLEEKQYFYYISGKKEKFDLLLQFLKRSKKYKQVEEMERLEDTLLLLVTLEQKSYIQNIIQQYNGFFIDLHTAHEGWEYWHVGVIDKKNIAFIKEQLLTAGEVKTLYIGEVDFAQTLLSKQQKKIFLYAYELGYYEVPRKTTIVRMAAAFKLNQATVGEHLQKAENKVIKSMARRI